MHVSPSSESSAVAAESVMDPWSSGQATVSVAWPAVSWRNAVVGVAAIFFLLVTASMRWEYAQRHDVRNAARTQLQLLPNGSVVRPMALGYHHVAADLLWLNIVQVLGERDMRQADYAWLYHAFDVVTTLDPHYVYAYDAGGVVLAELAGRVDWSDRLLEKGIAANPSAWRLPFQKGFNAFFHEQDYVGAADAMAMAARLPGRPAYVPELAARLYVEGKQPALALDFLDVMERHTDDAQVLAVLERRKAEVMVERDLDLLTQAAERFRGRTGQWPVALAELVRSGDIETIPIEPFGGTYRIDAARELVVNSTHPHRMHLHRAADALWSIMGE